jgi:hypothetical protein
MKTLNATDFEFPYSPFCSVLMRHDETRSEMEVCRPLALIEP